MQVAMQQQGNDLTLSIPKKLASEVGLHFNSIVEILLVNGNLLIKPVIKPQFTLEQLLADITEDNLHNEIDTGNPVGSEIW